jgi:23S rRNA pseudouridine2605 synthase
VNIRVQKLIAQAGIASRRAAEELIEQGRVRINGEVAKLGDKADIETDVVTVDGERLRFDQQPKRYVALYKPQNVLTTSEPHDTDDRQTVFDLIPNSEHLFPIGRLDVDSEGLVVLTNDGELANRLSHPRYRHTKTYHVTVVGLPTATTISRWENGIFLEEDGKTAPCFVEVIKGGREVSVLRIVMLEGKKRQIRRVASALGHPVRRLIRTQIGMLTIEGLKPGDFRDLTGAEVNLLGTPSSEIKHLSRRARNQRRAPSGQQIERPSRRRYEGTSERSGSKTGEDRPRRPYNREGGESRPRRYEDTSERSGSKTGGDRPRRPYNREGGESRPRRYEGSGERSSNRTGEDRPRRPYNRAGGENRPRRYEDSGERTAKSGEDRPRRPYNREGGENRPRRYEGSGERTAKSGEDRPRRPYNREGGENRPRRYEGSGERSSKTGEDRPRRPYNREGGENRPPRRYEGSGERSSNRTGEDRPRHPYNREGGESRPPRRYEGSGERGSNRTGEDRPRRPYNREGGENRPRRYDGSGERSSNRTGEDRPFRSEGSGERASKTGRDRPHRPYNRESGQNRPPRKTTSRPASSPRPDRSDSKGKSKSPRKRDEGDED